MVAALPDRTFELPDGRSVACGWPWPTVPGTGDVLVLADGSEYAVAQVKHTCSQSGQWLGTKVFLELIAEAPPAPQEPSA